MYETATVYTRRWLRYKPLLRISLMAMLESEFYWDTWLSRRFVQDMIETGEIVLGDDGYLRLPA